MHHSTEIKGTMRKTTPSAKGILLTYFIQIQFLIFLMSYALRKDGPNWNLVPFCTS